MDTNRKIIIGAIAAAVVVGGAAIGLILSRSPESADISTILRRLPRRPLPKPCLPPNLPHRHPKKCSRMMQAHPPE